MKFNIFIALLFLAQFTFSQSENSVEEAETKELPSEEQELSKYQERLERVWRPRLWPHDDFSVAAQEMNQHAKSFFDEKKSSQSPDFRYSNTHNWISLGPKGTTATTFQSGRGIGRINRLAFSPNFSTDQTMYASSWVGGLWRSTDGGLTWNEFGTDTKMPYSSVADIATYPTNPNIIYITTGTVDYKGSSDLQNLLILMKWNNFIIHLKKKKTQLYYY